MMWLRAEKLLSSAAKIVFLIMHQLRLYTGLMANSTSYLLLVDILFIEIGKSCLAPPGLNFQRPLVGTTPGVAPDLNSFIAR